MTNTPDPTSPEAVERFTQIYNGGLSWDIVSNHNGEWVRHSDYAALSGALEAERANLRHYKHEVVETHMTNEADALARAEAAEAERDALRAELAEAGSQLEAMIDAFEEYVALPDKNCSCHIAPPCGDCETYSFARETVSEARAFLARHQKETDT